MTINSFPVQTVEETNKSATDAMTAIVRSIDNDILAVKLDYVTGDDVAAFTQVTSNGVLFVSNVATNEPAIIAPIGESISIYDGTPTLTNVIAKQVITGTRVTAVQDGYVSSYSIDTVAGNSYDIFSVYDPSGVKQIEQLFTFTATTTGTREFTLSPIYISSGIAFDIISIIKEPDPAPVINTADLNYQKPNSWVAPTTNGDMIHANKLLGVISIFKIDSNSNDISALLLGQSSGDEFIKDERTWSVQAVSDEGTYVDIFVAPAVQSSTIGVSTVEFNTVASVPVSYNTEIDAWLSEPNIQGLYIADGTYEDIVPDDNAYGICNIKVQDATFPVDWTPMASGGGTSSPTVDTTAQYYNHLGLFPYHKNTVGEVVITDEEPVFTSINTLNVTDNLPTGEYELLISYTWSMPDTNDSAIFRLDVQGVEGESFKREPKDVNDKQNRTVIIPFDHAGGPLLLEFYGSITLGGNTLTISSSHLRIERKS